MSMFVAPPMNRQPRPGPELWDVAGVERRSCARDHLVDVVGQETVGLPVHGGGRRVGYDSEEAFSRAFKRVHGVSPSHGGSRRAPRSEGSVEGAAYQLERVVPAEAQRPQLLDVLVRGLPRRLLHAVTADHAAGPSAGLDDAERLELAVGARDGVGRQTELGGQPAYGRQLRARASAHPPRPGRGSARAPARTAATGELGSMVITHRPRHRSVEFVTAFVPVPHSAGSTTRHAVRLAVDDRLPRPRGDHADPPRSSRGDDRPARPGGQRVVAARLGPRGAPGRGGVARADRAAR